MSEITTRGKIPLLVGGTMPLLQGAAGRPVELPDADEEIRTEIDTEAAARGWPAMHAELASVDPQDRGAGSSRPTPSASSARWNLPGERRADVTAARAQQAGSPALPSHRALALVPSDRGELHRRIEARFDAMLERGLVKELRGLRKRHPLRPSLPSMRCVGYRQAWQHLDGKLDRDELRDRGIFRDAPTRQAPASPGCGR